MPVLKRIKGITNIGVFSNYTDGGKYEFEKLTFIYGLNSYGKTTLTDIFQSLKNNDASFISERKTIPDVATEQRVELSVKDDVSSSEKSIIFQNDNWENDTIAEYIEVFGSDFIHKNLFTGLTIERGNKENFTQFILGEQGVALAQKIKEKKEELGRKRKDSKNKIPTFVKEKSETEVQSFLEFSITGLEKGPIGNTLYEKKIEVKKEQERLQKPSQILDLPEPEKFEVLKNNIIQKMTSLNNLLYEDYEDIKDESLKKFNEHLSNNFSEIDNAENWIKIGLTYCKDHEKGNCPFCGQNLDKARSLIELYQSYFDKKYISFIKKIEDGLKDEAKSIENIIYSNKTRLQTACGIINRYKDLIKDNTFQSNLHILENTIELIDEENLNNEKKGIATLFKTKTEEKLKAPYKKVNLIDFSNFKKGLDEYFQLLNKSKELINSTITSIDSYKNQYRDTAKLLASIVTLNKEITALEYQIARIEQDKECETYTKSLKDIDDFAIEINDLDIQLKTEQSQYINKYFNEINRLFKLFGSNYFLLGKETDNRGHFPVYSIDVKYHGKQIPNEKLRTVFSDSDRRALSLAVFWAKINLKSDEDKSKVIIILDDPITSFDDNRIKNSVNLFNDSLNSVSQLIILTHYPHFIKRFLEITNNNKIKIFELIKNSVTSYLSGKDYKHFTASEFEKIFFKIYGFINRDHSESIKADLRIFFETLYLPTVFAKQIKDKSVDCSSLDKMIDGIFDNGNIKDKMHEFRKTTCENHHIPTTSNDEDLRNFAREMMEFLFSFKFEAVK